MRANDVVIKALQSVRYFNAIGDTLCNTGYGCNMVKSHSKQFSTLNVIDKVIIKVFASGENLT